MPMGKARFCVYAHVHDGSIFYIGQGRLGRPFETTGRNRFWYELVNFAGGYTIEILCYYETMTAAMAEEVRLIKLFQPACNLNHMKTALETDVVPIRDEPGPFKAIAPALRLRELEKHNALLAQQQAPLEAACHDLQHKYRTLLTHTHNLERQLAQQGATLDKQQQQLTQEAYASSAQRTLLRYQITEHAAQYAALMAQYQTLMNAYMDAKRHKCPNTLQRLRNWVGSLVRYERSPV